MTRRRKTLAIAAASAVLLAGVAVVTYELSRAPDDGAASRSTRAASIESTAHHAERGMRDGAPQVPGKVDIARVEAALARMKATTARISREQIIEEQNKMAEAKARFEAIKVPEPTLRPFTDQNGTRWLEVRHASGEVRYELAPESDVARDGSSGAARSEQQPEEPSGAQR